MHVCWGEANSAYAVAWLSKRPGRDRNHRLPVLDKTLLELDVAGVRLFATHLSAGRKLADEPHRIEEMEAVVAVAGDADVLVGDFNAVHPNDAVGEPHEPLEHVSRRPIELALARGFVDAYRSLNADLGWTYTTAHPWARFDHVFTRLRVRACRVVAEAGVASDHFPVVAELATSD
jgi:endonuclease/exonuclease/phosphatase family metal-dependent hydrolase